MEVVDTSPFPFQGPLPADAVVGREDLLEQLTLQVTRRQVTALIGPRRYGKTSVLRKLAATLTEVTTVWVDLYGVEANADLAIALETAMQQADVAIRQTAEQLGITAGLNLGVARATLARPARSRPDPAALVQVLLDNLVTAARHVPTLLILDEFSALTSVDKAAAKFRTALQHHYRDIGIIFAGSAPTIMRNLFSLREEPFYGQADLIDIGPLSPGAVGELLMNGFASSGRDAGVALMAIYPLTDGHPQRAMQLADAVWHHTPPGARVTEARFADALTQLRSRLADPMSRLYDAHSEPERKTLRIIAHHESPTGAAGQLLGLAKGSAQTARKNLLDAGDLIRRNDIDHLTDPLFADWIRQTLPLP